jgi:hypothetical protein
LSSRLVLLVAGLWIGILASSWGMASITFGTAARLSANDARPELRETLAPLPAAERTTVLRFMASEVNRTMFLRWLYAQLPLAVVLIALTGRQGGPWLAAAAALMLLLVQFGLYQPILTVGQSIDFAPRPLPALVADQFRRLHRAYVILDLVKMAALAVVAWRGARAR